MEVAEVIKFGIRDIGISDKNCGEPRREQEH